MVKENRTHNDLSKPSLVPSLFDTLSYYSCRWHGIMVPSAYWGKGCALRRHSRASGIMDLRHTRMPAPGDLGYDTLWAGVREHGMEGGTR